MKIKPVITQFEKAIDDLISDFKSLKSNYFFTEKELHSYFYAKCLNSNLLHYNRYNLVHTEYPSPFKCATLKEYPFIKMVPATEKRKVRTHIDLVLLNPNFIEWLKNKKEDEKFICGLTTGLFSDYILKYYQTYHEFYKETGEPFLLYALEFKFFRHSSVGIKYPAREVIYDIEKLKLMQSFNPTNYNFNFCENTKALVFVSKANDAHGRKIEKQVPANKDCKFIFY